MSAPEVWELELQKVQDLTNHFQSEAEEDNFYCSPRFCESVIKESIQVDTPPAPIHQEEVPVSLPLGPALTMGTTAVLMGAIAVINWMNGTSSLLTTVPTVAMAVTMLCET